MATERIYESLVGDLPPCPVDNAWDFMCLSFTEERLEANKPMYIDCLTDQEYKLKTVLDRTNALAKALYHHPLLSTARTALPDSNDFQTVGLMSITHIDYPTVIYACLAAGVPFATMPSSSTADEAQHLLSLSHAAVIFAHSSLVPRILEAGYSSDRIILIDDIDHVRSQGQTWKAGYTLTQLIQQGQTLPDFVDEQGHHPVPKCGLSHVLFSSGSSGKPKGVMLSHQNLMSSLLQVMTFGMHSMVALMEAGLPLVVKPGDRMVVLGILPMYHAYGLMAYIMRTAMMDGSCVCLLARWDPKLALSVTQKYRITGWTLVPALVTQFLSMAKQVSRTDLSSLTACLVGAAALSAEPMQRFIEMLIRQGAFHGDPSKVLMTNGYGMSETTVSITGWPNAAMPCGAARPGTVGILLPGHEARVVKTNWAIPEGEDVPVGESGELLVRGRVIMQGYLDNPTATRDAFTPNGWFKTGDEIRIDPDGQFFYIDRLKDIFKHNGLQVAPSEISSLIVRELPHLVLDCVVIGMPPLHERQHVGEEAWAFVRLSAETAQSSPQPPRDSISFSPAPNPVAEQIKHVVKLTLAKHKWVHNVVVMNEFPKGPTGKVLVRQIKSDALARLSSLSPSKSQCRARM